MLIKRMICGVVCVTLAGHPVLALAQEPVAPQDAIPIILQKLQAQEIRIGRSEKTSAGMQEELGVIKGYLKELLAQRAADQRAAAYSGDQGKKLAQANSVPAEKAAEKAIKTIEKVKDGSLGLGTDGKDLKETILNCVKPTVTEATAIKNAGFSADAEKLTKLIAGCSDDRARTIIADLKKNRDQALKTWSECRDLVVGANAIGPEGLPKDPGNTSAGVFKIAQGNIAKLKGLTGDAKSCADSLEKSAESIRNIDSSAGAMAAAMNMVGTVCMASGGNPYVCGGAFILALLMSLFSDGGGKGKGETTGGGNKGKGVGSVPGSNMTPKPAEEVGELADGGGTFGGDQNGALVCDTPTGGILTCRAKDNPRTSVRINPNSYYADQPDKREKLAAVINSGDAASLKFCTALPAVAVNGLILLTTGNKYYPIGVRPNADGSNIAKLNYGPESNKANLTIAELCEKSNF